MEKTQQADTLFTKQEAMGVIRMVVCALGRDGGLTIEAHESKALSRMLDEAMVALLSDNESS